MQHRGARQRFRLLRGQKKQSGRQLARVSATQYHETLWSELFAGNCTSIEVLQPAVEGLESSLDLSPTQRQRLLWRLDGGFGTEAGLRFMQQRGYQFLAKGFSGKRAEVLARQVRRWDPWRDVWLGTVPVPSAWGLPHVQVVVQRRLDRDGYRHSYYLSTQPYASKVALLHAYHGRGAAEIEQFREDKQALALTQRRKQRLVAQQALLALSDLAHNLTAHFRRHLPPSSGVAHFGLLRTIRDLLQINGTVRVAGADLYVGLDARHPYADAMRQALMSYSALDLPP